MMGWSFLGFASFQALSITTAVLCLPTVVAPFEQEEEECEDVPENEEDVELNPEARMHTHHHVDVPVSAVYRMFVSRENGNASTYCNTV